MKIDVSFSNLEQLKQVYDPIVVEKSARSTVKQLNAKAATRVSRAVRKNYPVSASAIKSTLTARVKEQSGVQSGFLIYLSRRISLRHFATSSPKPKVKTRRGVRYGVRVKSRKDRRAGIVEGAFWGTPTQGGEEQIFRRIGLARLKIKKLTMPAIAQMVGGEAPIAEINAMMEADADKTLQTNLDFFLQKQIGVL